MNKSDGLKNRMFLDEDHSIRIIPLYYSLLLYRQNVSCMLHINTTHTDVKSSFRKRFYRSSKLSVVVCGILLSTLFSSLQRERPLIFSRSALDYSEIQVL